MGQINARNMLNLLKLLIKLLLLHLDGNFQFCVGGCDFTACFVIKQSSAFCLWPVVHLFHMIVKIIQKISRKRNNILIFRNGKWYLLKVKMYISLSKLLPHMSCMYIYIYIHTHIHTYMYIYTYTYICPISSYINMVQHRKPYSAYCFFEKKCYFISALNEFN